jgi:hypothetical protein
MDGRERAVQLGVEKTARVRFATAFAPGAHTLVVNGLRDLAGNVMSVPWELHFSVRSEADTSAAAVTWNAPPPTGVTSDFRPRIHFSEPVLPESLEIYPSPQVPGTVVLDASRRAATFIPARPLAAYIYRFYAYAMDESGHELNPTYDRPEHQLTPTRRNLAPP